MLFENLNIIEPILKALQEEGYTAPTPIQEKAIPHILSGKDLLGCAQTGTGKTAAFAIPILQNIFNDERTTKGVRPIRALVLAPTRELAIQIGESFDSYSKHMDIKTTVIFGGVSQRPQTTALRAGVDVLIATPGRMIDLLNQKYIKLENVKHFVLDEADRMLDMGMIYDVRRIIAQLPAQKQTMFFSATMPSEISKLVNTILREPVKVEVTPVASTIDAIKQGVYFVGRKDKKSLLTHLLKDESIKSVLVFSRTKHGANAITKDLINSGIEAQAIHGNKSQNARQLALSSFKEGKIRVLVATDIAARGIDVDELSHVINFDLPDLAETYVHRIGRTGRAGLSGIALSFCDEDEKKDLKGIEKLIGKIIPLMENNPYEISTNRTPTMMKESDRSSSSTKKSKRNWGSNSRGSSSNTRGSNSSSRSFNSNSSSSSRSSSSTRRKRPV
ncbi:MAG: DEAD/DEAH box helicase [Clostridium sp.]